jgi:endonuclease-8
MAEGPLVHYNARQLRRALRGKMAGIEFGVAKLKQYEPSLQRVRIKDVEAYGKQFRIRLAGGRVILVHLMMWGSWRIYRRGETWERPRQRARLVLRTTTHEAVAYSAPVVRLLSEEDLGADSKWGALGPDPLRRDFSQKEFLRRLEAEPKREIGEALLDQKIVSGIGNILRIEILFRARIHPHRKVGDLSQAEIRRLLGWILRLMRRWLADIGGEITWLRIYRQRSKPCPRCGGRIEFFKQGGRITYACSECQT